MFIFSARVWGGLVSPNTCAFSITPAPAHTKPTTHNKINNTPNKGKDKLLKYWDLDRFELLLTLPGHHAELRALAVSAYGDTVLTGALCGCCVCCCCRLLCYYVVVRALWQRPNQNKKPILEGRNTISITIFRLKNRDVFAIKSSL